MVDQFEDDIPIVFSEEQRKNEVMNTVADITKGKRILGWNPNIDLENGIKRIIECL